jgi:hypothetical protein
VGDNDDPTRIERKPSNLGLILLPTENSKGIILHLICSTDGAWSEDTTSGLWNFSSGPTLNGRLLNGCRFSFCWFPPSNEDEVVRVRLSINLGNSNEAIRNLCGFPHEIENCVGSSRLECAKLKYVIKESDVL